MLHSRSAVCLTVALVVLLTVAANCPRLTYAGCGDYVVLDRGHDYMALHATAISDDVLRSHELMPSPVPGRGPGRCNGIDCSQRTFPPLAPLRITAPERLYVCLLGSANPPSQCSPMSFPSESLALPACLLARVFRPPR